ncbi:unnamed protein product [Paramecium octaurelia]|uniref:Transmembrane protein n=1 Tax=Paramecium octaurelia TaxID=43137 RepID=A0A8S1VTV2_PAROT|nr:unnamed protein product [Paramecium octaurelia]
MYQNTCYLIIWILILTLIYTTLIQSSILQTSVQDYLNLNSTEFNEEMLNLPSKIQVMELILPYSIIMDSLEPILKDCQFIRNCNESQLFIIQEYESRKVKEAIKQNQYKGQ